MARDKDGSYLTSPMHRRIRRRREEQGTSAVDLAKRVGISPSYLSLIESGERVPSEEVAIELARALRDEEDLYRAWAHASRRDDLPAHLARMERYRRATGDPEFARRIERGDTLSLFRLKDEEPSTPRTSERLESASARARRALAEVGPAGVRVPVLPDDADPDDEPAEQRAAADWIFVDRSMLPPDADRLFAYRPGPASLARIRPLVRFGDVLVLSRTDELLGSDRIHAIRNDGKVLLTRALRKGDSLLLLPPEGSEGFELIALPRAGSARGIVVGVVVAMIRTWEPETAPRERRRARREGVEAFEGGFLVRDCPWKEGYGWRPIQLAADLDLLEANPGTRIRFRLLEAGRPVHYLEMTPQEWRSALGDYVSGSAWRRNGYIVAVTKRKWGRYTTEFQERWAPFVRPADDPPDAPEARRPDR